jgi:hypothetical protein
MPTSAANARAKCRVAAEVLLDQGERQVDAGGDAG